MEQIIENYFNHDGQTAYIMTADHGMTDWGTEKPLANNNIEFFEFC